MKSKSRKTENVSVEGLTFSFSVAKMNELSEYYQFNFSYYSSLKDFLVKLAPQQQSQREHQ